MTALYTCEEMIEENELVLKYGGWNKREAGVADDLHTIDAKGTTWKVLMD